MIKNVLSDIGGVGLYGVLSVCLFFLVFTGILIWAFLQSRSLMQAMGRLPLSDEESRTVNEGESHHE